MLDISIYIDKLPNGELIKSTRLQYSYIMRMMMILSLLALKYGHVDPFARAGKNNNKIIVIG